MITRGRQSSSLTSCTLFISSSGISLSALFFTYDHNLIVSVKNNQLCRSHVTLPCVVTILTSKIRNSTQLHECAQTKIWRTQEINQPFPGNEKINYCQRLEWVSRVIEWPDSINFVVVPCMNSLQIKTMVLITTMYSWFCALMDNQRHFQ